MGALPADPQHGATGRCHLVFLVETARRAVLSGAEVSTRTASPLPLSPIFSAPDWRGCNLLSPANSRPCAADVRRSPAAIRHPRAERSNASIVRSSPESCVLTAETRATHERGPASP